MILLTSDPVKQGLKRKLLHRLPGILIGVAVFTPHERMMFWFMPLALLIGLSGVVFASRKQQRLKILLAMVLVALSFYNHTTMRPPGHENARRATCQSNLKQIGMALAMYSRDWDGCLPPENSWKRAIPKYIRDPESLRCPLPPGSPGEVSNYACNGKLCERLLRELPDDTPMVYDAGSDADLATDDRPAYAAHNWGFNLLHADGHVSWYKTHKGKIFGMAVINPPFYRQPVYVRQALQCLLTILLSVAFGFILDLAVLNKFAARYP